MWEVNPTLLAELVKDRGRDLGRISDSGRPRSARLDSGATPARRSGRTPLSRLSVVATGERPPAGTKSRRRRVALGTLLIRAGMRLGGAELREIELSPAHHVRLLD